MITLTEIKRQASILKDFLKQNNSEISQSSCLQAAALMHGFKDWNTASAALKSKVKQNSSLTEIMTVGDMRQALEAFDDSAMIDASYTFKLKEFEIDQLANPEDEIYQEFSFTLEEFAGDIASLKLNLEHESMSVTFHPYHEKENCDFLETQMSDES